jgi:hypothetical protein
MLLIFSFVFTSFPLYWFIFWVRRSVVCWNTMLQAGRSRVPISMRSVEFFSWPNPSSRTMALGSTQSQTEMRSGNLPGGKGCQPHRHLWADCLENVETSTSSYRPPVLVTVTALPLLIYFKLSQYLHFYYSLSNVVLFTYSILWFV